MEYRRVENTGILGVWKENELVGEIYTVDELWKRRVYITVSNESKKNRVLNNKPQSLTIDSTCDRFKRRSI